MRYANYSTCAADVSGDTCVPTCASGYEASTPATGFVLSCDPVGDFDGHDDTLVCVGIPCTSYYLNHYFSFNSEVTGLLANADSLGDCRMAKLASGESCTQIGAAGHNCSASRCVLGVLTDGICTANSCDASAELVINAEAVGDCQSTLASGDSCTQTKAGFTCTASTCFEGKFAAGSCPGPDSRPSTYMQLNNKTCEGWAYGIKKKCNKNEEWKRNKFCEKSCCAAGVGYGECRTRPMTRNGIQCSDYGLWTLTRHCSKNKVWAKRNICENACCDAGFGYDDCPHPVDGLLHPELCVDDEEWTYKHKSQNCAWTKGFAWRCKKRERNQRGGRTANAACRATCGACSSSI